MNFMIQFACWLMPLIFISYFNTKQLELDLVFELMIFSNDCLCVMLWICCHKFITFNRFSICAHLMVTTFDVSVTSNIDEPLQNMIFLFFSWHVCLSKLITFPIFVIIDQVMFYFYFSSIFCHAIQNYLSLNLTSLLIEICAYWYHLSSILHLF